MKSSFIDKVIGYFSPDTALKRLQSRIKADLSERAYDAAKTFNTDDWSSATVSSANTETRGVLTTLRAKARDAIRNNPHATKAINVLVSNTVGPGIRPKIKGRNALQEKRIQQAWREWGETTCCDANGKHNFYGLQSVVFSSIVESGETISLKEIDKEYCTLRILESDYIADIAQTMAESETPFAVQQGVKVDKRGQVQSYFLYENHPGDLYSRYTYNEIPADRVDHVYMQLRPGQLRGVTWFHSVIRTLEDLAQFENATLISKKIQACFSVLIKTNGTDSTLSPADLLQKRQNENMLEPGSIRYLEEGQEAQMVSPAQSQDYDPYTRSQLRKIASGLGITYEALTSDYSQVNFSSGRMGHQEFRRNVETWQYRMLIPLFCEPSFEHFLLWCRTVKAIPTEGVTCEWVTPKWTLIDPQKEMDAIRSEIRMGLTTYKNAVSEQGYDPEEIISEIVETNKQFDDNGIILDIDPRKTTQAGILQIEPTQPNSQKDSSIPSKVPQE